MIFARDENGIYKKDGGFEHANKKVSYLYIVWLFTYRYNVLKFTYLKIDKKKIKVWEAGSLLYGCCYEQEKQQHKC